MRGPSQVFLLIFFIGFLVGAGVTLLGQYINKHVDISITFDHQHDVH